MLEYCCQISFNLPGGFQESISWSLFHQLWHARWTIFDSKNTHQQLLVTYGVHSWCQGHLATHEKGDLLGSLQCFLIDAIGWPDLPSSYPPMDSAVPNPCLSLSLIWAHHRSWSHVEVVSLPFYCITYDIEFLCQFKISKFENLGHSKFFLWVASFIKFSKPISISVRFGLFRLGALFWMPTFTMCDIYNV